MQIKKQQLEPHMEQWTASRLGKEYVTVCCHPAYLTYMQSTLCEMPGWVKHKLDSRLLGEISITSDMQMTPALWQSEEELKSLLMKVKEEWKSWLKAQHSENEDHGICPITSWEIDGETVETVADFILGAPKSLQMMAAAMKLKDILWKESRDQPR